jgi:pyruvate dehydrogenase E2 component (dihydrolipoamide acetyltransferase)
MAFTVTMPELGESVTEGTVTRWLKEIGDSVEVDEPLLEVSTDKVDTEIPSPVAGTLLGVAVAEDETVEVGAELATIGTSAERSADVPPSEAVDPQPGSADDASDSGEAEQPPEPNVAAAAASKDPAPTPSPEPPAAPEPAAALRPPARAATPATAPSAGTTEPMPRLRQIIAQRMTESLATSAQLTTVQEVDITRVAHLRAAAKGTSEQREGAKLTYLPFFAKAVVEALAAFPDLNSSISEDGKTVTYHQAIHLAIAVDTPRGLLVPVIRDAQDLGIAGLARRIADVAERTRTNRIGAAELSGGTFTITNIGSVGALFDTPIINQPQVAILATEPSTGSPPSWSVLTART